MVAEHDLFDKYLNLSSPYSGIKNAGLGEYMQKHIYNIQQH